MSRMGASAWIMTASGWRQISGAPQVVFVPERRVEGPILFWDYFETGGRLAPPGVPSGVDQDGYDWLEALGGDE